MKNEIKNKIKLFKKIQPDEGWKLELRNELVGESYLYNPISFERVFASLSLAGLVVFVVIFNTFNTYFQELEQIQFTHLETEMVEGVSQVQVMEVNKNKELLEYLTLEVDIDSLEEYEKLSLAKESTKALMEEITQVEERISTMITMIE